MKRLVIVMTVLASFVWVACQMPEDEVKKTPDTPETPNNPEVPETPARNYAQEYWGEWLRMDTGEKWYISGGSITINGRESSNTVTLTRQSSRVVEVGDGGRKYYLYASRVANASFTGRVVEVDQSPRSAAGGRAVAGGKGWINVVVKDLDNGSSTTVQTEANGKFTVPEIIPGDRYQITPEGGTPVSDGEDMGTITISDGVNFKTSIEPQSANTNMAELYAGTSYSMAIVVENTGTEDATAAVYQLTFENGLSSSGNTAGILGTIKPGRTKMIQINLNCSSGSGDYTFKRIGVQITDPITNKTWDDSVSLRFFNGSINFGITTPMAGIMHGIIVTPANNVTWFETKNIHDYWWVDPYGNIGWNGADIKFPRLTNGDYLIVLAGADADTEMAYSLGFDSDTEVYFGNITETAQYEPNNTEETAAGIGWQEEIIAYLHENDFDYYKLNFENIVSRLPAPSYFNAAVEQDTAELHNSGRITFSWSEVPGASFYFIEIGSSRIKCTTTSYTYTYGFSTNARTRTFTVYAVSPDGRAGDPVYKDVWYGF
jgi:hypothetical protein